MKYSAAEFDGVGMAYDSGLTIPPEYRPVISAALRIAANVTREGVIEGAITQAETGSVPTVADSIRKALTGEGDE